MEAFTRLSAVAAPLLRENVDTDAIIPSREIRTIGKTGLANGLFAGWRYLAIGGREPDPQFVLNRPEYAGARILLGGANFGCGSSREHAVWALHEYGFRAILAPSFAPIFRGNCVRNGLLPAEVPDTALARIAAQLAPDPQRRQLTIDLEQCSIVDSDGSRHPFAIDDESRRTLLEGLDAIDVTLLRRAAIDAFEARDRELRPWIYLQAEA
jgi:3-isopropylmalate/(R)-2-methylmalate dehydratase small subunit